MLTRIRAITITCGFILGSCVTSLEPEVEIHESIENDSPYYEAFRQATSQYKVISNFETHYTLYATKLSKSFRSALSERYQRLFNEPQPILEEASDKLGFFVSLYTANRAINDLNDETLWNVQMDRDGTLIKPSLIKKLSKKERWQPFFAGVNPWSKEYLVLFDSPPQETEGMVSQSKIKLIFSNPEGKVAVTW